MNTERVALKKFLFEVFSRWDARFAVSRANLIKASSLFQKRNRKFLTGFLKTYREIPRNIRMCLVAYYLAEGMFVRADSEKLRHTAEKMLEEYFNETTAPMEEEKDFEKAIDRKIYQTFEKYKKLVAILVAVP